MKLILSFSPNFAAVAFGIFTAMSPMVAHADTHASMANETFMHVSKSPTCGCCGAWVDLAREEGYSVEKTDTTNMTSIKIDAEVPQHLWACHTAMIDGYVIEGHVPFAAIEKLLAERPDVAGISVPGMPAGSPGMGNDMTAQFDVISFGGDAGDDTVFFQAGQ